MERAPANAKSYDLRLREVVEDDLPIFFEYQLDEEANYMAAFTSKDPSDREAFMRHWHRILGDEDTINRTILVDGQVAGSVALYRDEEMDGPEVTYWIGRLYWGRGVATGALALFLSQVVKTRPLYARAAKDNIGSLRVLEKCGFQRVGEGKGFANARGAETEEYVLKLPEEG
ncbi:GNAT family N-acetyltransferase [Dictyobacter aurantiacus]|uniref:N-acetyltransferase n=1 Tax=Dictyobacter aurantiacus TaxID=1936993 RepID=A0A401ZK19_9CHLR|nr:GNAT family N-acetyltransferase [Dictyobacter aurantiacus]GCE07164.1 N-acetyltransferase [Dictyobacter aurantiacus]